MATDDLDEPESSTTETRIAKDTEWDKCNLLSLGLRSLYSSSRDSPLISATDGGGIRGYWTLLALKQLMEYVAQKEWELGIYHSFSPEDWPENVSQILHSAEEERKNIANATTPEEKCRALSKARQFLPCHYFDQICGSSTGA